VVATRRVVGDHNYTIRYVVINSPTFIMTGRIEQTFPTYLLERLSCQCSQVRSVSKKRRAHILHHLSQLLSKRILEEQLADQMSEALTWIDNCNFAVKVPNPKRIMSKPEPRQIRRKRLLDAAEAYIKASKSINSSSEASLPAIASINPGYYVESNEIS